MLFREKLFLANCDSVRVLEPEELRKRILTGLTFANGIIASPNALLDNPGIDAVLAQRNVVKYLNEEGLGKFVVRGFGIAGYHSLEEYFEALPADFIISSLPGQPSKGSLSASEMSAFVARIRQTQQVLKAVQPVKESLALGSDALRDEIIRRISDDGALELYFGDDGERQLFIQASASIRSRSQWYGHGQRYFGGKSLLLFPQFRSEVIDPAYNSLFVSDGEGFLQDNIKYLEGVPARILDVGVTYKALRREIELIKFPLKVMEFVSACGTGELVKFITDEAIGYIEDRLTGEGEAFISRKNWFGLYPKLKRHMGLEVK